MRACSSWKAGTGTSLLNGAAQLGLKLFNRNMKAPSVRRTRPSEVTAHRLSPASTPLPAAPALLPLFSFPSSPAPPFLPLLSPIPSIRVPPCTSSSSHTTKLLHQQAARSPSPTPCQLVHPASTCPSYSQDPFSPLSGCVSSLTPSQSQTLVLFSFSCKARPSLHSNVCPLPGMPYFCPCCKALHSHTCCVPLSPHSLLGGGRAKPCPPWQHPTVEFMAEEVCFRNCIEGESLELHTGHCSTWGPGEGGASGDRAGLVGINFKGDEGAKW